MLAIESCIIDLKMFQMPDGQSNVKLLGVEISLNSKWSKDESSTRVVASEHMAPSVVAPVSTFQKEVQDTVHTVGGPLARDNSDIGRDF